MLVQNFVKSTLDFSNCQNSERRIELKDIYLESSFATVEVLIDILLEEIKPVIGAEFGFNYRKISLLIEVFGTLVGLDICSKDIEWISKGIILYMVGVFD